VLEHSIAVTVTDSGIGITAEMLPHIFEPFVRDRHAMAVDSGAWASGLPSFESYPPTIPTSDRLTFDCVDSGQNRQGRCRREPVLQVLER
jgi:hypothetical protein